MRNLLTRTLTGAGFLVVMLGGIWLGSYPLLALLLLISIVGVWEFFLLAGIQNRSSRILILLCTIALIALAPWFALSWIALFFLMAFLLISTVSLMYQSETAISTSLHGLFVLVWVVAPLVLLLKIGFTPDFQGTSSFAVLLSYFLFLWTNDTFAYLTGKAIGRHALAPKISAGKTIEGSLGGLLATIGLAIFLSLHYQLFPLWKTLLMAIILAPVAVVSDLFESIWKRKAGVKDSGHILPGHGGILDRFDSVFFTAPLYFTLLHL